jgi:zinc protease
MGWGVGLLFDDGRLSLSEAFFLNNQALVHQLATRYPSLLTVMPEVYDSVERLAHQFRRIDRDALGLLWDRDTVAFYGDPAWEARYPCTAPEVGYRLEEEGGAWTLFVTVLKEGGTCDPKWGSRPFVLLLPERVTEIRDVACDRPVSPVVTDRFALVPLAGVSARGEKITVTFKARVTR